MSANGTSDVTFRDNDILKLGDVAEIFKFTPMTIYRLVRKKRIPHFKIGNQLRFSCTTLRTWMAQQQREAEVAARVK